MGDFHRPPYKYSLIINPSSGTEVSNRSLTAEGGLFGESAERYGLTISSIIP